MLDGNSLQIYIFYLIEQKKSTRLRSRLALCNPFENAIEVHLDFFHNLIIRSYLE